MKSIVVVVIECSSSPVSCGWKEACSNPTQSKINHLAFRCGLPLVVAALTENNNVSPYDELSCCSWYGFCIGSVNVKVEPFPSLLFSAHILPP
jgi:hypothetical protein